MGRKVEIVEFESDPQAIAEAEFEYEAMEREHVSIQPWTVKRGSVSGILGALAERLRGTSQGFRLRYDRPELTWWLPGPGDRPYVGMPMLAIVPLGGVDGQTVGEVLADDAWLLGVVLKRPTADPNEWGSGYEPVEFGGVDLRTERPVTAHIVADAIDDEPFIRAMEGAERLHQLAFGTACDAYGDALTSWRTDARRKLASGERTSRGEREYVALAARYSVLAATGHHDAVTQLATSLGMSAVTARQRIREARTDVGYRVLAPATNGKASGALTPRGRAVLREMLNEDGEG